MLAQYSPPAPELLQWVAGAVRPGARVSRVVRLHGGITACMDRITLDLPGGPTDVVLRRWPEEFRGEALVTREAQALDVVRGHGLPAPHLLAADADGTETGVMCSLTSALPGTPDLSPTDREAWLEQLARTQAAVHAIPGLPPVRWDGWYSGREPLDWLIDPGLRDAAREAAAGPPSAGPPSTERVLVHGDYQHFNVLWHEGRLSGVVDWPNAATGTRGSDVGHCRLNLAVLFDATTAGDYLTRYERAAGVPVDPRADLRALLCFDLDWQIECPLERPRNWS